MATKTVRIEGMEDLLRKLKRLQDDVNGVLDEATLEGAEVIREYANVLAPGPHIEKELVERTRLAAEAHIGPDDAHWYYKFSETGTGPHEIGPSVKRAVAFLGDEGAVVRQHVDHSGHPAEPFLRPAIDTQKAKATKTVGDVLRRKIEAV